MFIISRVVVVVVVVDKHTKYIYMQLFTRGGCSYYVIYVMYTVHHVVNTWFTHMRVYTVYSVHTRPRYFEHCTLYSVYVHCTVYNRSYAWIINEFLLRLLLPLKYRITALKVEVEEKEKVRERDVGRRGVVMESEHTYYITC